MNNISDAELQQIINISNSLSMILRHLKLTPTCPHSRKVLKNRMKNLDLTIYENNKQINSPFGPTSSKDSMFFALGDKRKSGRAIKAKLVQYHGIDEKCSECGLGDSWNNKPLVLHVDHINGNGLDNRLENLRLLCPNCHSQTETFAGRNVKTREYSKAVYHCSCGKEISHDAQHCVVCNGLIHRKINWPSHEILREEVWKHSMSEYAKTLGVSDKALKKYCLKHNIPTPNRSYSRFLKLGNKEESERIKNMILSLSSDVLSVGLEPTKGFHAHPGL